MENNEIAIKLRSVKKSDCKFLYDLLNERHPSANISHKKMPSFSQHVIFVLSKPYSKWYVIEALQKNVGSIYLTENDEIGIFIKTDFHGKGIATCAMNQLMKKNPRSRYLANVNPKNKKSIKFFKNYEFNLIQHTYELKK
jgi:RimJ/RimL family protein N-acetyltransferase